MKNKVKEATAISKAIEKAKKIKEQSACEIMRLVDIKEKAKKYLYSIKGIYLHIFFSPILKLLILTNIAVINTGIDMAKADYTYYSKKLIKLQHLAHGEEMHSNECWVGENLPDGSGSTVWEDNYLCFECAKNKTKENF